MAGKKIEISCEGTSTVSIDNLEYFQGNLKELKNDQYEKLKSSLLKYGFRVPVFVWGKYILDGHHRIKAVKKLVKEGYSIGKIPVVEIQAKTKKEAAKILLLINSRYANITNDGLYEFMSGNDMKIDDLPEVDLPEINMDYFEAEYYSDDKDTEPKIDKASKLNKIWKVKLGDVWKIGEHKLLCGDCTEKETAKNLMKESRATLVFTDPPYGVGIGDKNDFLNTFQEAGRNLDRLKMDNWTVPALKKMLLKAFVMWREYMASNCAVFVCSPQGGGLGMMMMMMQEAGLEVRHIVNWIKNSPTFSVGRLDYDYQHEPILFTWLKTHKRKKAGPFQTSLWNVNKPKANKLHPTMKPIELPQNAILNHTDEGDIVLDMFMGAGSTMVACENNKRKCMGVEINPEYCAVILQRMKDTFPQIKTGKE